MTVKDMRVARLLPLSFAHEMLPICLMNMLLARILHMADITTHLRGGAWSDLRHAFSLPASGKLSNTG